MAADLVIDHRVQDHPVDRQCAGMVGNQQRRAVGWKVLRPSDLDSEPGVSKPPQQWQKDLGGELGVESEFIDCVVATKTPTNEADRLIEGVLPGDAQRLRQRCQGLHRLGSKPTQLRNRPRRQTPERPRRQSSQLAEQSTKGWRWRSLF